MSVTKEVDLIAQDIADNLCVLPEQVNLSQVVGGWLADCSCGKLIQGEVRSDPIDAMNSLLEVSRKKNFN